MPSLSDTSPDWLSYELRELAFVSTTGADCLFREEHPEGIGGGGCPCGLDAPAPSSCAEPGSRRLPPGQVWVLGWRASGLCPG